VRSFVIVSFLALAPQAAFAEEPIVVIDPGHGGAKGGAKTLEGTYEKAIVLSVAKHAEALIEKSGARVVLTREGDRDVPLPDRIAIANKLSAQIFVSIHANSSPVSSRHGVETYILSPESSDDEAAAVVHLENEEGPLEDLEPGFGGTPPKENDLAFILGDLTRASAHRDSAGLAKLIQDRLGQVKSLAPSRGLRQAPFLVLRGATMPAALVEIGYLSHSKQGAALASSAVQKAAGEAIARAVIAFLAERRARGAEEP
jgi:N-acetylmuramoyl-L-alanine amidase